jgi:hypothetical protein
MDFDRTLHSAVHLSRRRLIGLATPCLSGQHSSRYENQLRSKVFVRTTVIVDMADASQVEIAICEGQPSRQSIRIGCAGWNIPREAAAHFTSGGSHLQRYSQVFNCCEINSSFYRPHKHQTWDRWAKTVPADFRFSVKAPRTITHEAALNCAPEVLLAFLQQISFLDDKLGPILIQLPPSLEFEYARVRRFLSLLRDNYSGEMVWEPRHRSWFDDRVDDLLKEFQAARVAAEPACVPAARRLGKLSLFPPPRFSPYVLLGLYR